MRRVTAAWLAVLLVLACGPGRGVQKNNDNEPGPAAKQIDIKVVTSAPYMHIFIHAYDRNGDIETFGPKIIAAGLSRPFESNLRYDEGATFTIEVRAGVDYQPGYVFTIRCNITEGLRSHAQDGPITVRNKDSESEVFCKYTKIN